MDGTKSKTGIVLGNDQMKRMTIFMKVTRDEYELPVAVADSKAELARMLGVRPSSVSHGLNQGWKKSSYVVVEVDDYED